MPWVTRGVLVSRRTDRQWRYDVLLVVLPLPLLSGAVVAWAFPVPIHAAVATGGVVAGLLLLAGLFADPPAGSSDG